AKGLCPALVEVVQKQLRRAHGMYAVLQKAVAHAEGACACGLGDHGVHAAKIGLAGHSQAGFRRIGKVLTNIAISYYLVGLALLAGYAGAPGTAEDVARGRI